MSKKFKDLLQITRDWLEHSEKVNGWNTVEYYDCIRCYFADESSHRTVHFGGYISGIGVAMHSTPQFSGCEQAFVNLSKTIRNARKLLNRHIKEHGEYEAHLQEMDKKRQIQTLKERLMELENDTTTV